MADRKHEGTFLPHPQYGTEPRFTGLNPQHDSESGVSLHWRRRMAIPFTAVSADLDRQVDATFPVTHYYDEERTCRDCGGRFIFFAAEQKH